MENKVVKPITESKYLSAENAWRYRSIMRLFYINNQKFTHWLMKEDVYENLSKEEMFCDYTIDQCRQDLDVLVQWGNLSAVQDTSKVSTYQQFVNKQFRYQMTEYAIEIERLTIRLENLFFEHGSLEPTLLERIKNELKKAKEMAAADQKTAGAWWSGLSSDFQRLNQNYQDYIRDWNSVKAEQMMKSKSFLIQKEKLVDYLRNFIKELQNHSNEIEQFITEISDDEKENLLKKITDYENDIPRIDMEALTPESIHANLKGKFESIESFFCNRRGQPSEVERILEITNDIIRKITRYAAGILDAAYQYSNRKDEYRKAMELFQRCNTVEEMHKLSAMIFGVGSFRHIRGSIERETESITSSIWDESAYETVTEPRVRTYKEKMIKTAICDYSENKKAMMERILNEKEEEQRIIELYIDEDRISFENLGEIEPFVRKALLRWLMKALLNNGEPVATEYGRKYRIVNMNEKKRCVINSSDGNFEMPAFVLHFEGITA